MQALQGKYELNKGSWIEIADRMFDIAKTATRLFNKGDDYAKKETLTSLQSNLLLSSKKLYLSGPDELVTLQEVSVEI